MDIKYRFLSQEDFSTLYKTNLAAFSDYIVPLQMTEDQFKNHIAQNAVNINLSVGAFYKEKLVGYTLNGFGNWNGKKTAYDAGTGIIPEYRRKGIGKNIFKFLIPKLKALNIEQMLLEVISNNEAAIDLYRKLGFEETRELLFFEQKKLIENKPQEDIQIQQIEKPVWKDLETFCDGATSWQFSNDAIERKLGATKFFGAYFKDKCVGYSIVFPSSGVVPQIAVDKRHRHKHIASMLLAEMQKNTDKKNKKLRLSNIDSKLESLIRFAERLEFKQTISQFEMILTL